MKTQFMITDVLSQGWSLTRKHIFIFAGIVLVYLLIASFFEITMAMLPATLLWPKISLYLADFLFSTLFGAGLIRLTLQATDGQEPEIQNFLLPLKTYAKYFIASIGLGIAILIGLFLLIVPGIYLMVRFIYVPYIVIDSKQSQSLYDSFEQSWNMTRGHFWELFAWSFLYILILMSGFILLIIGLLVTIPYAVLAMSWLYRNQQLQYDRIVRAEEAYLSGTAITNPEQE